MRVVLRHEINDLVILEADRDVCDDELELRAPQTGTPYTQLGLSALMVEESPFSVSRGVFVSNKITREGHLLGTAGSNPGDSGGGAFC